MFLFVLFPKRKGASSLLFNFKLYNYATLLLQEHNKSEKHQPEVLGRKIIGAQENTIRIYNNERGGAIMDAGNNHMVITFNSEGVKLDFLPMECSTAPVAQLQSGEIILCKDKGMRINFIRVMYCLCKMGFFTTSGGGKAADSQVFRNIGNVLSADLSSYTNDLCRAMQDGKSLDKHTRIFEEMIRIITDKFNSM